MNKHADMLSRVLGHVISVLADLYKEIIYAVPSVKELPHVDAGGVQAKTTETKSGIGVEQNSPVVKLLPEHQVWGRYGFFSVFHRTDSGSLTLLQYPCQERVSPGIRRKNRICEEGNGVSNCAFLSTKTCKTQLETTLYIVMTSGYTLNGSGENSFLSDYQKRNLLLSYLLMCPHHHNLSKEVSIV
jgi:hypothetical protein